MIPFLILLCSLFENCGAGVPHAAVSSSQGVNIPHKISASMTKLGNPRVTHVTFPVKQNSSKSGISLTVSDPKQPVLRASAKHDNQDLFSNDENNDDDILDELQYYIKKYEEKERDEVARINLEDVEEHNKYMEEQEKLYEQTKGKEGLDKISKNLLDRKHASYSKISSYELIKEFYGIDLEYKIPKTIEQRKNLVTKLLEGFIKMINKRNKEKFDIMISALGNENHKEKKGEFDEFLQYLELFAPDTILVSFLQIPDEGRQLLFETFDEILTDLKKSKNKKDEHGKIIKGSSQHPAVHLKKYHDKLNNSDLDADTKERIDQFFTIVQNDFNQLPIYLTENFASLFRKIATLGLPGLKEALIRYLEVWNHADPQDQQMMANAFPKLAFFYNDSKSMKMNDWAYRSVKGNFFFKIPLLILLKMIFLNKPKLENDSALYKELREKLTKDFEANKELIDEIGKFFKPAKPLVGSVKILN
uniref:Uncharacterized protein n=1 Tax=Meloidogyne incognita TaxID=6306 RepID=A0A914KIV1_MELIC